MTRKVLRKGSAAAKAWGSRMKRLRMGTTTPKVRKTRSKRRGIYMARRRRSVEKGKFSERNDERTL